MVTTSSNSVDVGMRSKSPRSTWLKSILLNVMTKFPWVPMGYLEVMARILGYRCASAAVGAALPRRPAEATAPAAATALYCSCVARIQPSGFSKVTPDPSSTVSPAVALTASKNEAETRETNNVRVYRIL